MPSKRDSRELRGANRYLKSIGYPNLVRPKPKTQTPPVSTTPKLLDQIRHRYQQMNRIAICPQGFDVRVVHGRIVVRRCIAGKYPRHPRDVRRGSVHYNMLHAKRAFRIGRGSSGVDRNGAGCCAVGDYRGDVGRSALE